MITQYDKTIAAAVVGLVALIVAHFGFSLGGDVQTALVTLITAAAVYFIPNK